MLICLETLTTQMVMVLHASQAECTMMIMLPPAAITVHGPAAACLLGTLRPGIA
jgi:hypothetical protein